MTKLLLVDDEIQMQKLIAVCLSGENYMIDTASSGEEAIQLLTEKHYDGLLLDIMMPEMTGYEVLTKMQQTKVTVPVILLTALGETDEIVKGLNLGADDYITKPFEPSELKARVKSVLRRFEKANKSEKVTQLYGITLHENEKEFMCEGKTIPFTRKEYQIFLRLFFHPGQVFTREQLLELEWDDLGERYDRNIDTHIKNIREKLNSAGQNRRIIETVWGVGYKLSQPEYVK
ncbi:response regulator transcription factor [Alkalihalobacillus sp. MEB130]|uniref:response regulator transcription factor n=1 Tax=Alkalihalobacillus sp. MEB130 TaxID=2976704 RepID=UPI0028DE7731|nr:response regulator transcription factor [Alkalihalobacillus sp. MEB130]MDT8861597.1 response regulator transcription factor [Alkalihalobacillus sp. MEB130]